jgi:hypothetical protein
MSHSNFPMLSISRYLSHQFLLHKLPAKLVTSLQSKTLENMFLGNICHLVAIGGLLVVVPLHVTHSAATKPRASCVLQAYGCGARHALVLGRLVMTCYKSLPVHYFGLEHF